MDCSPPGSSVHGLLQARTLEWFAMPSSRGSSRPRDGTLVSCIAGRFFTVWATREAYPDSQSLPYFGLCDLFEMQILSRQSRPLGRTLSVDSSHLWTPTPRPGLCSPFSGPAWSILCRGFVPALFCTWNVLASPLHGLTPTPLSQGLFLDRQNLSFMTLNTPLFSHLSFICLGLISPSSFSHRLPKADHMSALTSRCWPLAGRCSQEVLID